MSAPPPLTSLEPVTMLVQTRLQTARVRGAQKLLACAMALTVLMLLLPTAAVGAEGVGLPLAAPASMTARPLHFTSDARQAISTAESAAVLRALHAREHPLLVQPFVWAEHYWYIDFSYRQRIVAVATVSREGRLTGAWTGPQAIAPYTHGHYGGLFDSAWIVVPFSLLFLVPFVDRRRLGQMRHLDALALLSFLASYYLFDHGHLGAAVWLVYPPLIYLLARMLHLGLRRTRIARPAAPLLGPRTLAAGLLLLVAARVLLGLLDREVIDVGYASVIGAHRILHGHALYFASSTHGDTYGPIAYLAYVPFTLLFGWSGTWDYLPAAHAAAITFDLVTVAGLFALGRRSQTGQAGIRRGLLLAWAWAACPFTLMGLMLHTNDGLIAMLCVLALLAFQRPLARGGLLGLAAAAKFSPAALLPLFAGGAERRSRAALLCCGSFGVVVVSSTLAFLPPGGLGELYNHTIGYQLGRADVFSAWALHPGLWPVKDAFAAAAVLLALWLAFVPRRRGGPSALPLAQAAALAAAVMIAVQLPAVHWFYYYVIWFLPFVLVALLGAPGRVPSPLAPVEPIRTLSEPEPELVYA